MPKVSIATATPSLGETMLLLAGLIIAVAVIGIARGFDVRLVLLVAAFSLAGIAGDIRPVVREFLATFSNEKFVIPICSAMGFAYVLKHTQCDQHLVYLLIRPLRRAKLFLIPGVVAVGFLVNIPVISQTSTAVCIGAVIVPLMRAAGVSPLTIGACILLGSSLGGELLNPGAPELNTIAENQQMEPGAVVPHVMRLVFYHLAIATAIFWWLSARAERATAGAAEENAKPLATFRVDYLRAIVPIFPLVLLFLTGPPLNVFKIPEDWIVDAKARAAYGTRLIGLAMLIGVLAAALSAPRRFTGVPKAFFEGAGYAFAAIVSIIVTANCFGTAVKQVGLAEQIEGLVKAVPHMLIPIAASVPLAFAALSGSGMASTQSLYGFFVKPAESLGLDCIDLGAIVSLAAAAGRTMSPVAAVTLMCATMTGTSAFTLAKRVAVPLLVSWALVVTLRMMKIV